VTEFLILFWEIESTEDSELLLGISSAFVVFFLAWLLQLEIKITKSSFGNKFQF
jgi:hypothetical protein